MTNPHRKIGAFLSLAVLAGAFGAAKRHWKQATPFKRFCLASLVGAALGVVLAMFLRLFY